MPNPRNEEPGALSVQQQQPQSINFSSVVPIKKRRFPVIQQPVSPSQEEKSPSPGGKSSGSEENILKNKQDSNIPNEGLLMSDAKNMDHRGTVDFRNSSDVVDEKEKVASSIELTQANMDIFASTTHEAKPLVSLGRIVDLKNKVDLFVDEKSAGPDPDVPEVTMGAYNMNVKQEIVSGQIEGVSGLEISMGDMHVELSLGPKDPRAPILENQNSEPICSESYKSDPSLLRQALSKEKLVMHEENHGAVDNAVDNAGVQVCANRSKWDLNTTMDVWEGSTNETDDMESSLTIAGTVGLGLNKGKHALDRSSSASVQPMQQCNTDDSLGLRLAVTGKELGASRQHSALSGPKLNLQQVELSATNVSRTVKAESLDVNSKYNCSLGSNNNNRGSPKLSPVKREIVDNQSLETVLPSVSPQKVVDYRSVKLEVIQDSDQEYAAALLPQSIEGVMQHQESCASSSVISTTQMLQNLCHSRLSTFSEITVSGDVSNQSEHSFHSKVERDHNDIPDESTAAIVSESFSRDAERLSLCKEEKLNAIDPKKCEMVWTDEHALESCQYSANDEERINISTEILEEDSFGSDCESHQNAIVDKPVYTRENICVKEDDEFEDGEVREPRQHSGKEVKEERIVGGKETENLELVDCDSRSSEPSVLLNNQEGNTSDFDGKTAESKNDDETNSDQTKESVAVGCEAKSENKLLSTPSDQALVVGAGETRSVSATTEKQLDVAGGNVVEECPRKEVSVDGVMVGSLGLETELGDEGTNKVVNGIHSKHNDLSLSKSEASIGGDDAATDSNNTRQKSRIINLPRASVVTSSFKARSFTDKLTSLSGKERYSNIYGRTPPRANRDEICNGGPNKFAKDRAHDQSARHSIPSFMPGKGRLFCRFGSSRNQWDSDHDFAPQTYNNSSARRTIKHKHVSSVSDVELECNGYRIAPDGAAVSSGRRKGMDNEFPSGQRDAPAARVVQMSRRFPRNVSPSQCSVEDASGSVGPRHSGKFVRHSSDDILNPVYTRSEHIYDELEGQRVRCNRNFATMQRKVYPRNRSKSPVRSRSPGPWSSPRRRSPNGHPESKQHRSPGLYRTGKMRSPDQSCFRDEMCTRARGPPPYGARHPNDIRDMDFRREHIHPRPANSNRRSPPTRVFGRSFRKAEALDSREMEESDEYINRPLHPNNFHELLGDGNIDERRKFIERRGPLRSFRPSYVVDSDNFRLHMNDGPNTYRFCPEVDAEFVERSNMREREFDGQIKHQFSRRMRNIEEQQKVNYPPGVRVWNDDGFADVSRVKRRRF